MTLDEVSPFHHGMKQKTAVIIGAGPAGLTAAYELLTRVGCRVIVLEASQEIGGISRTACFKGNRLDMGGHRFFTSYERVLSWWANFLPLQTAPSIDDRLLDRKIPDWPFPNLTEQSPADPEKTDDVMLIRRRMSRIFFRHTFFPYPLALNVSVLNRLGFRTLFRIVRSYLKAVLFPIKQEVSLEDFLVNRFGRELYQTFFKDYTEKVWGVPCSSISPEWGAQRIKGLSLFSGVMHAVRCGVTGKANCRSVEKTLTDRFLYPKLGPGQIWEKVAATIVEAGGTIQTGKQVSALELKNGSVTSVTTTDCETGETASFPCEYVFSSMPVRDLVITMGNGVPEPVRDAAIGLQYRSFITVGILAERFALANDSGTPAINNILPDTWIYIQEPGVKMGRIQVFNNWSPYLVADQSKIWLGLEYFCDEGDDLWKLDDAKMLAFASGELVKIGFVSPSDILDAVVVRVPKAYPVYSGSYNNFHLIREFLDTLSNLFPVGRNGMHRYNNMDHSMLASMVAVDMLVEGSHDRERLWKLDAVDEYGDDGMQLES